jgi:hypothetical protein
MQVGVPLSQVMHWSASDYCMVLNTFAASIVWPVLAVVLVIYQMKSRKAGDPPIDVLTQLGQMKGLMSGLQNRVGDMDQKVNQVAMATPATTVPEGTKESPLEVVTHEGLPTPEVK